MSSTIELAAAYNWCDRRCERCPLATSCPIPGLPDREPGEILVAGKVARIASEVDLGDDELWSYDTVPNLLVVERLLATARSDVDRTRARLPAMALVRFDEADALLRTLLSPLLGAITERDRAVFAALAAAGRAPSPLATR